MWLPEDWGVRIAGEVRTPDRTFILDQLEINEYAMTATCADPRVDPVFGFDDRVHDNPAYLALVDVYALRRDGDHGLHHVVNQPPLVTPSGL